MRYQMNRTQYKQARRLIRDNGYYALHWMSPSVAYVMEELRHQKDDDYTDIQFFFKSCTDISNRLKYRHAVRLTLHD